MLETNVNQIKYKVGLLNLAEELKNISRACRTMGLSRDTFYRYKEAVESGGVDALVDRSRRKPNLKNRIDETTEKRIVELAIAEPGWGKSEWPMSFVKKALLFLMAA